MNANCKPSIATEVHASHERPHRLALLATSPVATGEAIMPLYSKASPARAGEGDRVSGGGGAMDARCKPS